MLVSVWVHTTLQDEEAVVLCAITTGKKWTHTVGEKWALTGGGTDS